MCLAVPGKIISIDKEKVIVDYQTEKREARLVEEGYHIGDYVLVQGKIVIQKVPEEEVQQWCALFSNGA